MLDLLYHTRNPLTTTIVDGSIVFKYERKTLDFFLLGYYNDTVNSGCKIRI